MSLPIQTAVKELCRKCYKTSGLFFQCIHRDMRHSEILENTQEARVA